MVHVAVRIALPEDADLEAVAADPTLPALDPRFQPRPECQRQALRPAVMVRGWKRRAFGNDLGRRAEDFSMTSRIQIFVVELGNRAVDNLPVARNFFEMRRHCI
jgi:hypothetical protein